MAEEKKMKILRGCENLWFVEEGFFLEVSISVCNRTIREIAFLDNSMKVVLIATN